MYVGIFGKLLASSYEGLSNAAIVQNVHPYGHHSKATQGDAVIILVEYQRAPDSKLETTSVIRDVWALQPGRKQPR